VIFFDPVDVNGMGSSGEIMANYFEVNLFFRGEGLLWLTQSFVVIRVSNTFKPKTICWEYQSREQEYQEGVASFIHDSVPISWQSHQQQPNWQAKTTLLGSLMPRPFSDGREGVSLLFQKW
jgi:hypothetical protein